MKLRNCSLSVIVLSGTALLNPISAWPQSGSGALEAVSTARVVAKRGSSVEVKMPLRLKPGYHVNSNTPADTYLIPLRLTWSAGPLEAKNVAYPPPKMEKYEFSEKPLSVYSGAFDVITRFQVPATAPLGDAIQSGKLRYQACTDKACFPPKTLDLSVAVEIR